MRDTLVSLLMMFSADFNCLAQNVYYEARNQPTQGQLAVAEVTLNRRDDSRWPDTICEVVHQKSQVSWVGNVKEAPKGKAWRTAQQVALDALLKTNRIEATHFHATYVNPGWASKKRRVVKIKDHIFYA